MIELIYKKTCGTCRKAVKLLQDKGIDFAYREYTESPLGRQEIVEVLDVLGVGPKDVLRKHDKAYKEQGLTGEETEAELLDLMAEHPTLLQRPIGIKRGPGGVRAALGRPPENLLALAGR